MPTGLVAGGESRLMIIYRNLKLVLCMLAENWSVCFAHDSRSSPIERVGQKAPSLALSSLLRLLSSIAIVGNYSMSAAHIFLMRFLMAWCVRLA